MRKMRCLGSPEAGRIKGSILQMIFQVYSTTKGKPIKIVMAIFILLIKADLLGAAVLLGLVALHGLVSMRKVMDLHGLAVLRGVVDLPGLDQTSVKHPYGKLLQHL